MKQGIRSYASMISIVLILVLVCVVRNYSCEAKDCNLNHFKAGERVPKQHIQSIWKHMDERMHDQTPVFGTSKLCGSLLYNCRRKHRSGLFFAGLLLASPSYSSFIWADLPFPPPESLYLSKWQSEVRTYVPRQDPSLPDSSSDAKQNDFIIVRSTWFFSSFFLSSFSQNGSLPHSFCPPPLDR